MKRLTSVLAVILLLALTGVASAQLEIKVEKRVQLEAPPGFGLYVWNWPVELEAEQRNNILLVDGPAGEYRVNLTAVNATVNESAVVFDQQSAFVVFSIGQKPEPPGPDIPPDPKPNPNIPDDEMGNLARSVDQWASELQLKQRDKVAAVYGTAAKRLSGEETPILPTVEAAAEYVINGIADIDLDPPAGWKDWSQKVAAQWRTYYKDRASASRFFELVALGLGD